MVKYYLGIFFISLLVIGALVYGFGAAGGPREAREEKFDATRLQDIRDLKRSVEDYYNKNKRLPATLAAAVSGNTYGKKEFKDPENSTDYGYSVTGELDYKICAVFGTDATKTDKNNVLMEPYYGDSKHPKGNYCFDYQVTQAKTNSYYGSPSPFSNQSTNSAGTAPAR